MLNNKGVTGVSPHGRRTVSSAHAQSPGPCVQGARWGPLTWHRGQPCPADEAACSYAPGV